MAAPLQIFIAYARKDSDLLEELRIHLKPLERTRRATIWYDGEIEPGAVWEEAIKKNLHAADIILLLVSAQAIASDYFYEKEMTDALERHEIGEARVIPLVIKPCRWQSTPLSKLQALPKDGKPISTWIDRDEAWDNAVEALLKIIEDREEQSRLGNKAFRNLMGVIETERHSEEKEQQQEAAEAQHQKKEAELWRRGPVRVVHRRSLDPFHDLMLPIKGGTFKIGGKHDVTLKDFHLCKHPITQAQWKAIMGGDPSHFKGDDLPVERVNWDDAQNFIKKLNQETGENYRLPSEAEWEFAARGGIQSKGYEYAGSNKLDEVGWHWENSGDINLSGTWNLDKISKNNCRTHPVGGKKANELVLYAMSGNVWEWCQDTWHDELDGIPADGSAWTSGGDQTRRVVRGGSWDGSTDDCRTAFRLRYFADDRTSS